MPNGIPLDFISHNAQVREDYENDPLVHDKVSARWFTEFTKTAEECLNRALEIDIPILATHGADDKLVDPQSSIEIIDKVSSSDKTLKLFEGLYHEPMNEVPDERKKVIDLISNWILSHIPKAEKKTTAKKTEKKK